jgi:transposase
MLPIVNKFIAKHPQSKPIVVADAAMLDEDRLQELRAKHISYIVGARLSNANAKLIQQIHDKLQGVNGAVARFESKHGSLICDYSDTRYKKEVNELNKQIKKAEDLVAKQSSGTKAKFIKKVSNETIELNTALIDKRKLLLGIKGYCTDLSERELSSKDAIHRYHQLWRVEQSFRMSKSDLQTRPIYHRKEEAVKSHILICFIALIVEKYLELSTGLSLRNIRTLVWNITQTEIQDSITKEIFTFTSPKTEILNSKLNFLIKKWNLSH